MPNTLMDYFGYDFVQHALIAGSLAGALSAVIGYFVLIRRTSFAAHALAHIGFTGATGAALFAISPMVGMLGISVVAGAMMGTFGNRIEQRDIAIGMVLSIALGVGLLFLALYRGFSGQASAILFGNIFGVSSAAISQMIWLAAGTLIVLLLVSRRLFFASIQPDLAEARGISLAGMSIAFMVIVAIAVTLASQVVGILLVFALIIGPAGIAARHAKSFWPGVVGSVILALVAVCAGILLACLTSLPPSFWITAILFVLYSISEIVSRATERVERNASRITHHALRITQ